MDTATLPVVRGKRRIVIVLIANSAHETLIDLSACSVYGVHCAVMVIYQLDLPNECQSLNHFYTEVFRCGSVFSINN